MAFQQLKTFLSSIDNRYPDYAYGINQDFRNKAELETAERSDLLHANCWTYRSAGLRVAAGLITRAAKGTGVVLLFLHQSFTLVCIVLFICLWWILLQLRCCSEFACNICAWVANSLSPWVVDYAVKCSTIRKALHIAPQSTLQQL